MPKVKLTPENFSFLFQAIQQEKRKEYRKLYHIIFGDNAKELENNFNFYLIERKCNGAYEKLCEYKDALYVKMQLRSRKGYTYQNEPLWTEVHELQDLIAKIDKQKEVINGLHSLGYVFFIKKDETDLIKIYDTDPPRKKSTRFKSVEDLLKLDFEQWE